LEPFQSRGGILYPLVVGRAINLHPVAILLLLTAGAVVAGIVGALLAIPLGAVAWELLKYLRLARLEPPPGGPRPSGGYLGRLRHLRGPRRREGGLTVAPVAVAGDGVAPTGG
jgi:hypothetical protein